MSISETNSFMNPKHNSGDDHFLYQKNQNENGLAKQRSAPSSFLQQFLDTINEEDNNSSGEDEWEEALLFSALLDDPNHQSPRVHACDYGSGILRQSSSPAAFFRVVESSSVNSSNTTSTSANSLKDSGLNKRKHGEGVDLIRSSVKGNNLIQFHQETTVTTSCQLRAKRGCATHPRSIAERNRRTRITRNMKKLQDVCPNMNKQTNTADMLELAVEYIKDLQNQVQILSDMDAKCACSSKHHELLSAVA